MKKNSQEEVDVEVIRGLLEECDCQGAWVPRVMAWRAWQAAWQARMLTNAEHLVSNVDGTLTF